MKFTVNAIIRRFGFRSVLIANGVICAVAVAACTLFGRTTPHAVIALVLFVGGFFQSLQFTSLNALAYADVPTEVVSGASSLASMAQQLFNSLGVIVAAQILRVTLALHGGTVLTLRDISPAFAITGSVCLIAVFFLWPLERHAGAEVSGHWPADTASAQAQPAALSD
jgi:MFS family permease